MAYLKDLKQYCRCGKGATVEMIDARNASLGVYCRKCGQRLLRQLRGQEKAERSEQRRWVREDA